MYTLVHPRLNVTVAMFMIGLALAACTPGRATPTRPTLAAFPTAQCLQEEVLPKIQEVQPAEPRPGREVLVSAFGGYFRDTCGGVNESARLYKIYFDDEPVANLQCYAGHCVGKFVLPEGVEIGAHCLGVQKGTCQMELRVAGE
jgi:hypothetical protein